MSSEFSSWRIVAAVGLALCLAIIGWGLFESSDLQEQAEIKNHEYAQYTSEKIAQACSVLPSIERTKCIFDVRDARIEHKHNQSDLLAQRQSALWAFVMAVAAVIGMLFSAVGIFLVWATFRETQLTAEVAHQALEHERELNRPWLEMTPIRTANFSLGKDGTSHSVEVEARAFNHGKSPAIAMSISAVIFKAFGHRPVDEVKAIFGSGHSQLVGGISVYPGQDVSLGHRLKHAVQVRDAVTGMPPHERSLLQHYLAVGFIYHSPGGRSYYTARIFHFSGSELPKSGRIELYEACAEQHGECARK